MKLPASLDWKMRAAVDLTVLAVFLVVLSSQGAPAWAMTLAILVAMSPSRVAMAGDLAALQATVRATIKDEAHASLEKQAQLLEKFLEMVKR